MAPAKKRPQQGKGNPRGNTKSTNDASSTDQESGNGPTGGTKSAAERKAKREAARQERLEAARKKQRAKRRKQIMIAGGLVVVLIAVIGLVIRNNANQQAAFRTAAETAGCTEVAEYESEGRDHLGQGQSTEYQTNPPTSGAHNPSPAPWGSYRETVEPETLVHNLEHGGIIIHYNGLDDSEIDALDSLVDSYLNGVISNPNPSIDAPIALASWTRSMECQQYSAAAIEGYISMHCNKGPEKLTTCES